MSLFNCPECQLQVSDKAFYCPHCGYPFEQNIKQPVRRQQAKRMRLPNGFGQISEIKGRNLRNPFRVMVTVGFNDVGRPICKLLKPQAYFKTYNEAYKALIKYNRDPYCIDDAATFQDVYERWFEEYKVGKEFSSYRHIPSNWNKFKELANIQVRELHGYQIKDVIEKCDVGPVTKGKLKSLANLVLDYAVQYELVERNVARQMKISVGKCEEIYTHDAHIDFTKEEIRTLWHNCKDQIVEMMLIQCYMGWRPQELCLLKTENVNINDWTIQGGMKTVAGKNRIVPVHSSIRKLVLKYYEEAANKKREYLFYCVNMRSNALEHMSYDMYRKRFKDRCRELNINKDHKSHDPRVHFITMCKESGVDEYAIKYFVGHSITDITEAVYTKRKKEWYASEIEKIKAPV